MRLQQPHQLPHAAGAAANVRVLLDLTTASNWRGKKANGIIRTERELALRLLRDPSLTVLPFLFRNSRLRAIDPAAAHSLLVEHVSHGSAEQQVSNDAGAAWISPRRPIARLISLLARLARAGARNVLQVVPLRARRDVALSLIHLREAVRHMLYSRRKVAEPTATAVEFTAGRPGTVNELDLSLVIYPRPGDILFTCGLGWSDFDWSVIAAMKGRGLLQIVCMVYDLIPIKFPTWIPANHDIYLAHFLSLIDTADEIVCISSCTELDLHAFAESKGRDCPPTQVVFLGADLPAEADPTGMDPHLVQRLGNGRFALAVGTFEVRKNFALLLDIWERLLPDPEFTMDLVIVGMRGWLADAVMTRMESSPHYGHRLFWLSDLGDGAVSWLYQHCHVMVYPSLYEGWGLPIVEALQHRRPVIASNRGAVPEACMGIAQIIDPDDLDAWCDAVRLIARSPRIEAPSVLAPTWDDTAEAIRSVILKKSAVTSEIGA